MTFFQTDLNVLNISSLFQKFLFNSDKIVSFTAVLWYFWKAVSEQICIARYYERLQGFAKDCKGLQKIAKIAKIIKNAEIAKIAKIAELRNLLRLTLFSPLKASLIKTWKKSSSKLRRSYLLKGSERFHVQSLLLVSICLEKRAGAAVAILKSTSFDVLLGFLSSCCTNSVLYRKRRKK